MKKSVVIAGIIFGTALLIGIGVWVRNTLGKKSIPKEVSQLSEAKVPELATWEDQAGFSFQYPKDVLINKHDEDLENYAHIEFTSATHSGRLIVWAKDTTYGDIAAWAAGDKTLANASIIDTTLGGKKAKKISISEPSKKLITGTIEDQILFTIETEPQSGDPFWTDTYATIVQSYAFTPLASDNSSVNQPVTNDVSNAVDEEEVLE